MAVGSLWQKAQSAYLPFLWAGVLCENALARRCADVRSIRAEQKAMPAAAINKIVKTSFTFSHMPGCCKHAEG